MSMARTGAGMSSVLPPSRARDRRRCTPGSVCGTQRPTARLDSTSLGLNCIRLAFTEASWGCYRDAGTGACTAKIDQSPREAHEFPATTIVVGEAESAGQIDHGCETPGLRQDLRVRRSGLQYGRQCQPHHHHAARSRRCGGRHAMRCSLSESRIAAARAQAWPWAAAHDSTFRD